MAGSLLQMLQAYQAHDKTEAAHQRQIIDFVKAYPNHMDRNLQVGHITASAWILDKVHDLPTGQAGKTLLTHHRKLDRWLQIGGHAEGETDIVEVSLREAQEESGLQHLSLLHQGIFALDIHRIPEYKGFPAHNHLDICFAWQADENEPLIITSESKDLRWVPLAKFASYQPGDYMMRMHDKTRLLGISQ